MALSFLKAGFPIATREAEAQIRHLGTTGSWRKPRELAKTRFKMNPQPPGDLQGRIGKKGSGLNTKLKVLAATLGGIAVGSAYALDKLVETIMP